MKKKPVKKSNKKLFLIAGIVVAIALLFSISTGGQKAAKMGDTVSIHFEGFLNGVAFGGGTGDFDLKLGSGQFVPGFESQLVGAKKDQTVEVKLKFPDQYVPGLAGKDVVFKVTVKDIK